MKTITLHVEESAVEKVIWFLEHLKDVVKIEDDAIDEKHCLDVLEKVNKGDYSGMKTVSSDELFRELGI